MATLNIKNFPEPLYEQLQKQAEDEHRSVAQQVIHLVSKSVGRPRSRSILELRGLGKEIWAGIDSAQGIPVASPNFTGPSPRRWGRELGSAAARSLKAMRKS